MVSSTNWNLFLTACVALGSTNPVLCEKKFISVQQALNQKLLKLNMKARGGYQDFKVSCTFQNISNDSLLVAMNPGYVLDNTDTSQQDIAVTQALKLRLGVNQRCDTVAIGFCCQNYNSAPQRSQPYIMGRTNDSNLIKLCNYIFLHPKLPSYSKQHAIWAVANGISSSSVANPEDTTTNGLLKMVCNIKKEKLPPSYFVAYRQTPGRVFSGEVDHISTTINYRKKTDQELSVVVCDSTGHIIKTLVKENYAPAGDLQFHFNIFLQHWQKGTYKIIVIENKESNYEKVIEV